MKTKLMMLVGTARRAVRNLALFAAVAAALGAWADTETVGDYTWTYRINGDTAEIYGTYDYGTYSYIPAISPSPTGAVTIPSTLGGKPVTNIGSFAFWGCSGLTSVTIPSSVTSIGEGAFSACSGLTAFVVDNGNANYSSANGLLLSKDGKMLIHGVNGAVTIPGSVTSIGGGRVQRLQWPDERDDSRWRDEHRGGSVLRLQRPDERDDSEQRDEHRGLCVLRLQRSYERDDPGQRYAHR